MDGEGEAEDECWDGQLVRSENLGVEQKEARVCVCVCVWRGEEDTTMANVAVYSYYRYSSTSFSEAKPDQTDNLFKEQ